MQDLSVEFRNYVYFMENTAIMENQIENMGIEMDTGVEGRAWCVRTWV